MIHLVKASRSYGTPPVVALDSVSLEISRGEFVAITGASGSGKSTLLNLLGGLDHPTSGEVVVDGVHLESAADKELTLYRRSKLGMVFQFFNLLPSMSVTENVELPLLLRGDAPTGVRSAAMAMLDEVGMAHRASHFPHQLSGGEMQRAAIARALVSDPILVLADEPTANLDHAHGGPLMELMSELSRERGVSFLAASHDPAVISRADVVFRLNDGRLEEAR